MSSSSSSSVSSSSSQGYSYSVSKLCKRRHTTIHRLTLWKSACVRIAKRRPRKELNLFFNTPLTCSMRQRADEKSSLNTWLIGNSAAGLRYGVTHQFVDAYPASASKNCPGRKKSWYCNARGDWLSTVLS